MPSTFSPTPTSPTTPDSPTSRTPISPHSPTPPPGSLKIFFGYAAGVGKTCAMLEAAHNAKAAGTDVVAGYVEPHQRPATQTLLRGLEVLPTLEVPCQGMVLREFDLDAAIRRKPQLILVDEMAHTNAKGCRHQKRYHDIEELLRNGIDVYTTVNVQHVESLNDMVESITGVTVRERVPDKVFDSADHVELVDIEPEELLERLQQGKIYGEKQVGRALENFFLKENLVALREIALRRTADMVNKAVKKQGGRDYGTDEHVLVCLSSSPANAKVIRTAGRMAEAFHGRLTALFVETSNTLHMSEENRKRLNAHARLAEEMGAQFATVQGDDVAWHVAEFAKAGGVSKIVMGRPGAVRGWFQRPNFIDQLTALAPGLDVYVIPNQLQQPVRLPRPKKSLDFSWMELLLCTGFLAASSTVGWLFYLMGLSEANIIMAYMLGVVFTSIYTSGLFYGFFVALGSVLSFNFLFTEPRFSLHVYDPAYAATFVIMLLASGIISTLARRLHQQKTLAAQRAWRTSILLETSRKLQGARDTGQIMRETARQLMRLLGRSVLLYPVEGDNLGAPLFEAANAGETHSSESQTQIERYTDSQEQAVAQWSFHNRKQAGAGTGTLSGAKCLYLCVRGQEEALGVVAVAADVAPLDAFEKGLLVTVLGECALALEKEHIRESKENVFAQARQQALRANLLRAISHDLRTPLTSISGNANMLVTSGSKLAEATRQNLYIDMRDDAMWLTGIVENILSITRLDSLTQADEGAVKLRLQPELLTEVVEEALRHLNPKSRDYVLHVELDDDLLMAYMDARLIMQVLVNLVDNAVKYTPPGSEITVSASRRGAMVDITVSDTGPGIPAEAQSQLFDMFFTAHAATPDSRRGLGLGLYLCKSIVTAHGGQIRVTDNTPHGAAFTFTLPAAELTHA